MGLIVQKLNIAIITHLHYAIAEPFLGGVECFTHIMAKKLIERGHRVTTFAAEGTDESINPSTMCIPFENFPKKYLFNRISKRRKETTTYREMMHKVRDSNFDIVFNNALHRFPIKHSHLLAVPMVTTIHIPPIDGKLNIITKYKKLLRIAKYKRQYKKAINNRCIAISKYIHQLWSPIVENEIIYNGVILENFKSTAYKQKEDYLFWFGRITAEKGTIYAIEAATKLGLPLKIAGSIYKPAYFDKVIKPRLNENIQYLGVLSHKELSTTIAKAKVNLCTPTWDEPYGLVTAEALACGTAVAAFNRGAMSEILDAKSGVLAKPNDVNSLAAAVVKAMKLNPQDCIQRAKDIADIEVTVDNYEKVFYELLSKS